MKKLIITLCLLFPSVSYAMEALEEVKPANVLQDHIAQTTRDLFEKCKVFIDQKDSSQCKLLIKYALLAISDLEDSESLSSLFLDCMDVRFQRIFKQHLSISLETITPQKLQELESSLGQLTAAITQIRGYNEKALKEALIHPLVHVAYYLSPYNTEKSLPKVCLTTVAAYFEAAIITYIALNFHYFRYEQGKCITQLKKDSRLAKTMNCRHYNFLFVPQMVAFVFIVAAFVAHTKLWKHLKQIEGSARLFDLRTFCDLTLVELVVLRTRLEKNPVWPKKMA